MASVKVFAFHHSGLGSILNVVLYISQVLLVLYSVPIPFWATHLHRRLSLLVIFVGAKCFLSSLTAFETRFPIDGYKPLQDPPVSDLAKASELVACLERLLPAVISSLILELGSKKKGSQARTIE